MKTPTEPKPKTLAACALFLLRNQATVNFWQFHDLTGAISFREAVKSLRKLGWPITSIRQSHKLKTGRMGFHAIYSLTTQTGGDAQESGEICL